MRCPISYNLRNRDALFATAWEGALQADEAERDTLFADIAAELAAEAAPGNTPPDEANPVPSARGSLMPSLGAWVRLSRAGSPGLHDAATNSR